MVTEWKCKPKQSDGNYSNIIPTDPNILAALRTFECVHFDVVGDDHTDPWKSVSCSSTEVVSAYTQKVSAFY